jgi:hypothetical protein
MVDKVAGFMEVGLANNGQEIALKHAVPRPDANGLCQIVLSPRYARYLANLLVEYAIDADANAAGSLDKERHYRQVGHGRKSGT